MKYDKYEGYLSSLGVELTTIANAAIREYQTKRGTKEEDFSAGYLMALHRVITLMQQDAKGNDITLESISLDKITENEILAPLSRK